jgi:2-oxoglutarate ferredoxin oxidoreductase subunit beta
MPPFNPLALGLAADGTFIARGYANETEQLAGLIAEAITHRGFGFVDILQPCVTYNKVHTYEWFEERVYDLGHEEYRPADRQQAMQVALEWPELGDDRIALGVLYRGSRKTHEEQLHGLLSGPLTGPRINKDLLNKVADEFF